MLSDISTTAQYWYDYLVAVKSGLITGKYNDGIPEDSRMNQKVTSGYRRARSFQKDGSIDKLRSLTKYAKKSLVAVLLLALAWCLKIKT